MQSLPSPSARRVSGPLLTGISEFEAAPIPQAVPVLEIERPPVEAEASIDTAFVQVLRANMRAAAQHTAMGHKGGNFRECSRAACRDAAKMIPHLEHVEVGATDAELELVLDRVLATLDTEATATRR